MRSLLIEAAFLAALAAGVVADPLHFDVNVKVELDGHQDTPSFDTHHAKSQSIHQNGDDLPEVDIDYEVHRASPRCENCAFYSFDNIPYAEPPVDDYRFQAAVPWKRGRREEVNNGSDFKICPQMQVGWAYTAFNFLKDYFDLRRLFLGWDEHITPDQYKPMPSQDATVHEDCLTLDVKVPYRAWNSEDGRKHPVVVWFFGGGYIFGSKTLFGSPAGLFNASSFMNGDTSDSSDEIIYVSVNYRLGAFGWLAGDSFEQNGGHENAGFSDQRRALEWVQEYIERFKGDPGRVTVMGQSAGASSILHHLTANGGEGKPLFQRAILQSPAFLPQPDRGKMEDVYQAFRAAAGAANFTHLKGMESKVLMDANAAMTYRSPYGQFAFGPVVDGTYIRDLPGHSLMNGDFHKDVKIMVGYNRAEGALFTPPWIRWSIQLRDYILDMYPDFDRTALQRLTRGFYPINEWDIDQRFRVAPVARALGDAAVNCNVHYLIKAYEDKLYTYLFNKYPGVHGQDANYTYWPVEAPPVNASVPLAQMMQRYFAQFIKHGNTTTGFDPAFDEYEANLQVMRFGDWTNTSNNDASEMIPDELRQDHCDFWQDAPYAPPQTARAKLTVQSGGSSQEM